MENLTNLNDPENTDSTEDVPEVDICKEIVIVNKNFAKADLLSGILKVGDKRYDLEEFRKFILTYWHPLVRANAIRPIIKDNDVLYTFDWAKIFSLAIEGGVIVTEFLKHKNVLVETKPTTLKQINLFD